MPWQEQYVQQVELKNAAFQAFAEKIVTLSTGALTLSIAFRHEFAGPVPDRLWLLRLSWVAFVSAIIMALLVQFGRINQHAKLAKAMRENGGQMGFVGAQLGCWFTASSFGMLGSFALAIISLAVFALTNLK